LIQGTVDLAGNDPQADFLGKWAEKRVVGPSSGLRVASKLKNPPGAGLDSSS
jgi:hypothetical protein